MAVYYATKAFVLSFSESLHEELRGTGVSITNLCPGATETNFSQTARSHRVRKVRAVKMSAAAVAKIGYADFRKKKTLSVPGLQNKLLANAIPRILPRRITARLSGHYNKLD
jgi:uncharacterized protein